MPPNTLPRPLLAPSPQQPPSVEKLHFGRCEGEDTPDTASALALASQIAQPGRLPRLTDIHVWCSEAGATALIAALVSQASWG